jgi:hypothetical protein
LKNLHICYFSIKELRRIMILSLLIQISFKNLTIIIRMHLIHESTDIWFDLSRNSSSQRQNTIKQWNAQKDIWNEKLKRKQYRDKCRKYVNKRIAWEYLVVAEVLNISDIQWSTNFLKDKVLRYVDFTKMIFSREQKTNDRRREWVTNEVNFFWIFFKFFFSF